MIAILIVMLATSCSGNQVTIECRNTENSQNYSQDQLYQCNCTIQCPATFECQVSQCNCNSWIISSDRNNNHTCKFNDTTLCMANSVSCQDTEPTMLTTPTVQPTTPIVQPDTRSSIVELVSATTITSITVILITMVILLILVLYWRYRIRVMRERNANMQRNLSYNVNTPNTNLEAQDPVYSIIADDQTTSKPPQLPPDRVPYYQEIENDKLGADYEAPIKSKFPPQSFERHTEKTEETLVEPYQDPVDARETTGPGHMKT